MENPSRTPASFWAQMDALVRKNLTFQKRRKKENGLLLLVLILVCTSLVITRKLLAKNAKQAKPFPPGHSCSDVELVKNFTQCSIYAPHEYPPLLEVPYWDFPYSSCKRTKTCPVTVLFTGSNKSLALDLAGQLLTRSIIPNSSNILNVFANGVFGTAYNYIAYGHGSYLDPAFYSVDHTIYNIQRWCCDCRNSSSTVFVGSDSKEIVIKCIQGLLKWRNSATEINDGLFKGFPDRNKELITNEIVAAYDFLNSSYTKLNISVWYKSLMKKGNQRKRNVVNRVALSVNLASNAYLKFLLGTNFKIFLEFIKEMPKHPDSAQIDDVIAGYCPQLFTSIVLDLILVILASLVNEKEENTQTMMKLHGLGCGPYWVISYVYFLAVSSAYVLCFVATCSVLGLGSFTDHSFSLQLVFLFVYINLQVSFSFLVARMFSKVRIASGVAYPIVFATGMVGSYGLADQVRDPSFPRYVATVMELYPGLALYRVFLEFSVKAKEARLSHNGGMTWEDLNDGSNGMKEVLIIMVSEWIVFIFVSYCLDNKSSIICLRKKPNPFSHSTFLGDSDQEEKVGVALEREKVEDLLVQPNGNYSIVCNNLTKVYLGKDGNPPKVTVNKMSLALLRGECFGMLGPDGAGRSSFINMMIGLTQPSFGTAFVEGLNIRTDMERVYTTMGVCPQHDLLWETLTAREHLLFYGRLKNLKGLALHRAVEESLSSVNLLKGGIADKQVGKYTRGMKRRLSVAISLIGDPKVVYMDEPSTRLDPASRDVIWNVVRHAKASRGIILTTHSAEEAEHLCDRLGVFVDGHLQCIGKPEELKAHYGASSVFTGEPLGIFDTTLEDVCFNIACGVEDTAYDC